MNAEEARNIVDNFNTGQFWLDAVESKIREYARLGSYSASFFLEFTKKYFTYQPSKDMVEYVLSELRFKGFKATLHQEVVTGSYITVSWNYEK